MAKKQQFRRSISVTAETYARLQNLAARDNRSISGIIEESIAARCAAEGIPEVHRDAARRGRGHPNAPKPTGGGPNGCGGIFTF